jgi:signal transduction histidine kinase
MRRFFSFSFYVTPSVLSKSGIEISASNNNWSRALIVGLLGACAYYAGTVVGFLFTPPGSTISTLWPPNAILLATLLLLPPRQWWILLGMVFPAHLVIQLHSGVPLARSVGWFFSNSAEAVLGAYCILRVLKGRPKFDSMRGVLTFLIFGFLLAPLFTSFLDAGVVVATGWQANYWTTWAKRLFTNMFSMLVVVPPLVIFGDYKLSDLRKKKLAHYIELGLMLTGVFLLSIYIFADATAFPRRAPVLMYGPIPFLICAAVRFGPRGLSSSLLVIALVSIGEAIHGRGPFLSASIRENVLYLQISDCILMVPLMLLVAVLSEHRQMVDELRTSKSKLIEAQEEERRRIASELHDDVGQQLALAEIRLSELKAVPNSMPDVLLQKLSQQLAEISADIREISHGLYPSILQHLGLPAAIRRLCREICMGKEVDVDVERSIGASIPPDVSLAIYRIAQEALHNVEKHSRAHQVIIKVEKISDGIMLTVRDDGIGFDADRIPLTGLGVESMRERSMSVGGWLRIISSPMKGTQVEAFAPISDTNIEFARTG